MERQLPAGIFVDGTYQTSKLARARWNVIDLLNHISRRAVSAQLFCLVDVEEAERVCKILSAHGPKITITTLLLKAISIVQQRYPDSRAFRLPIGPKITPPEPVAGFTVEREVDEGPAVFFGVIHGAHEKSLAQIATEVNACGNGDIYTVPQLAKERLLSKVPWILRQLYILIGLQIPPLRLMINSATFGLTSLGKFGMQAPVAPNVTTTIFGIGTIEERPVVRDGAVVTRRVMQVCLSADTAVLNIYQAARLLHDVKQLVQSGLAGRLAEEETAILAVAEETKNTADTEVAPFKILRRIGKNDELRGVHIINQRSNAA